MAVTSPFRTATELVTEALAVLGVLEAGQAADPEDFDWINGKLDSIFRKLAALEIVYVPDAQNIPGAWFDDLVNIVAGACATKFGATPDDYVKLTNAGLGGAGNVPVGAGTAAMSLKIMNRGRPTFETLQAHYF